MSSSPSFDPYTSELTDEEAAHQLECAALALAISELQRGEVKPGDRSLAQKAKWILETGAKQIRQGQVSAEFLTFVASALDRTLNGESASLDEAFGLKQKNHRPKKDPYTDPEVIAYLDEISKRGQQSLSPVELRHAQREAIDLGYQAKFGKTPEEDLASDVDPEVIKKRRDRIKRKVKLLGHY